eukprot:m.187109 g.187109  ORF g.187109 m.187109 type:complete len:552 (-) comp16985_c0_seq1:101-1756(-)
MRFGALWRKSRRKSHETRRIAAPAHQCSPATLAPPAPQESAQEMTNLSPYAQASSRTSSRASHRQSTVSADFDGTMDVSLRVPPSLGASASSKPAACPKAPPVSPRARWTYVARAFQGLSAVSKRAAAAIEERTSRLAGACGSTSPPSQPAGPLLPQPSVVPTHLGAEGAGSYVEFPIIACAATGAVVPPPRWQRDGDNGVEDVASPTDSLPSDDEDESVSGPTPASRRCSSASASPSCGDDTASMVSVVTPTASLPSRKPRPLSDLFLMSQRAKRESSDSSFRTRLTSSSSLYSVTSSGSVYLSTVGVGGEDEGDDDDMMEVDPSELAAASCPPRLDAAQLAAAAAATNSAWATASPSKRRDVNDDAGGDDDNDVVDDCDSDPDTPTDTTATFDRIWRRDSEPTGSRDSAVLGYDGGFIASGIRSETGASARPSVRRESCIVVDTISAATGKKRSRRRVFEIPLSTRTRNDVVRMLVRNASEAGAFMFRNSAGKVVLSLWDGSQVHHFGVNDGARQLCANEFQGPQFRKFFRAYRTSGALPTPLTCAVLE